jgi:hypothetical protein
MLVLCCIILCCVVLLATENDQLSVGDGDGGNGSVSRFAPTAGSHLQQHDHW